MRLERSPRPPRTGPPSLTAAGSSPALVALGALRSPRVRCRASPRPTRSRDKQAQAAAGRGQARPAQPEAEHARRAVQPGRPSSSTRPTKDVADAQAQGRRHQRPARRRRPSSCSRSPSQAYMTGNDTPTFEAVLTSTRRGRHRRSRATSRPPAAAARTSSTSCRPSSSRWPSRSPSSTTPSSTPRSSRDTIKSAKDQADAAVAEQAQISLAGAGRAGRPGRRRAAARGRARAAAAAAAAQAKAPADQPPRPPPAGRRPAGHAAPSPHQARRPRSPCPTRHARPGCGSRTPGAGAAIAAAQSALGVPYVWAGASHERLRLLGPRDVGLGPRPAAACRTRRAAQYAMTRHIPLSQLQPGDLVFFDGARPRRPLHRRRHDDPRPPHR